MEENKPTVYNVGIISTNDKPYIDGKMSIEYVLWVNMLCRCYDVKTKIKRPTYAECTTSESFLYYSNFKTWCNNQFGFNNNYFELDKDILVKGNKIYSEATCCFVPREINMLFTKSNGRRGEYPIGVCFEKRTGKYKSQIRKGSLKVHLGRYNTPYDAFLAYKEAKESYIKEVANKWKDKIDVRVYDALMNYEVEIND